MLLRLLNWFAGRLRSSTIPNLRGEPYLLRNRLFGRLPGEPERGKWSAYLHRFERPDGERELHNHPWTWGFSVILWGGYLEEKRNRKTGKTRRRRVLPGMINILGPRDFHRIAELKGSQTWTLFVTGRKAWAWGFLDFGRFVHHRRYIASRGGVPQPDDNPLPPWLLSCVCCGELFPPPAEFSGRVSHDIDSGPLVESKGPVCPSCGTLPYSTPVNLEAFCD